MPLSFLPRIVIVCLSVVIATVMTADNCVAQGPFESDFKSNPPCVSASSPCQLEFQPLAPPVARQLAEAKKLFDDKDFVGAQTKLEAILVTQPDSKIVLYDLALTYLKQGQREKALTYQQQALQGITHPYQRKVLDQLEREILYGNGEKDKTSLSLDDVLPLPAANGKNVAPILARDPTERTKTEIETVCAAVAQKRDQVLSSPSGVFNLAQCAEYDGRLGEAKTLYDQYLAMAPEALDREGVALRLSEIETFKDIDPSSQPRKTYQTGIRSLMIGAFNTANIAFQGLSVAGPVGRPGLLQAGMLSLLAGQRTQARQYFGDFLTQETNTDMRDYIGQVLGNEGRDNSDFSAAIDEVLKFTEAYDFVQAAAAIEKPLSIYPLSPAANTLAAFIALNTNNYPAARRSMDILWSQGNPVFFYAAVESPDQKGPMLFRVEISSGRVTLAHAHVGVTDLVKGPEGGKSVSPSSGIPEQVGEILKNDITRVLSTGSGLVVETSKGEWKIVPHVAFLRPREGWPARAFVNDYADLFSSYLGVTNVQLGEESTDAADRWRLAGKLALVALAAYAQGGGGYRSIAQGTSKTVITATAAASAALAVMNEYRLYQATMNNTLNRFLFRPLVPSGGTLSFMTAPNSASTESKPDGVTTTATGTLPLVQYGRSKTKQEKASGGFATLQLEKDEVRLQDISQAGVSMTVPCTALANSLSATESYLETHEGKIRLTTSPSPWLIRSYYLLAIQKEVKNTPEIQLSFSSNLRRAQVRGLLESHCKVGLPASFTVYVPLSSGQQWHEMFHGKMHLGDNKTVPFPSCENIKSLRVKLLKDGTIAGLEIETTDKQTFQIGNGDQEGGIRMGAKLANECGIPLSQ
jgi:tetratricopeptide (TPR) repeat protein